MRPRPLSLALTLTLAACSGGPAPVAAPPPPPVDPGPSLPPIQSPARWSVRPTEVGAVSSRLTLPDGCLFGTDAGTRWLVKRSPKGACDGAARPAPDAVDEALLALFPKGSELVALGARGSVFRAPSATAPFERALRGGPSLHAASGGPELTLGASLAGALVTLDDAGWRRLPGLPAAAHAADVAVLGKAAIVLAMPEAIFVTDDGGRSFEPVKLGTVGAVRATRGADGALVVEGRRGHVVWRPTGGVFSTKSGLSIEAKTALDHAPTLMPEARPSAEPIDGGFATIVGDQYLQVIHLAELPGRELGDGSPWALLSGKLDAALDERRLELGERCSSLSLAGSLGRLALGCVDTSDDEPKLLIYLSTGPGTKAERVATLSLSEPGSAPQLAVSQAGAVLIAGACPSQRGSCEEGAPTIVSQTNGAWSARRAAASELSGATTGAPAFSPDGSRAYFLGRRSKDDRACLFVSRDAGATFACVPFEPTPSSPDGLPPDRDAPTPFLEPTPDARITVGEDGTLGFPVVADAGLTWATADEDGRTTTHAPSPSDGSLQLVFEVVDGHGKRALALRIEQDDATGEGVGVYFETQDGGATWQRLGTPRGSQRGVSDVFAHGIACGHAGCVVGSSAVRFGWGGDAASDVAELSPPPAPPPAVQVLRTPLVCETVATAAWQTLDGAAGRFPAADSLARGKTLFSYASVTKDDELVVHASDLPEGKAPPRLTKKVLLSKPPKGQRTFELLALTQAEGYAALRLSLPERRSPDESDLGKPMRNVEVAWEHLVEGTSGHARIADAGLIEPGDLAGGKRLSAFVSMSRRGVFVRPHREQVGKTFFVEPGGKVRALHYPALPAGYRAEAVLASGPSGDEPLVVGVEIDDARGDYGVLIGKNARGFAASESDPWSFTAVTAARGAGGPTNGLVRNDYGWSHVAGRELGLVISSATEQGEGFATYSPFLAAGQLGPALELPTAYDLPDAPKPCSASERRDTPRGVFDALGSPFSPFPGTRHPVLVTDVPPPGAKKGTPSASPVTLLTDVVIVQGTKAAPCVSAWSAKSPMRGTFVSGARVPMGAVIAGDLEHAWLLRTVGGAMTEARPMRCKLDATASVPDLSGEPGNARVTPLRP